MSDEWVKNPDGSWSKRSTIEKTNQSNLQSKLDNSTYAKQIGSISGDNEITSGRIEGLERAGQLYGMGAKDIGSATQDIVKRRKAAMEGKDPASDSLRASKNAKIRAARASGANADQIRQIERESAVDISNQEYKSQNEALGEYQALIGNILGGTTSLEMGMGQLSASGKAPVVPQSSNSTVICTELHRQGYMSDEILEKDKEYGRNVRLNDPALYIGYIWMACPIVSFMRKSKLFTKVISVPGLIWANDMAQNKKGLIAKIGEPVCRTIGKILIELNKRGIVYA